MSIEDARDALSDALSTVEGLRVHRSVGDALDPPCAVVPIPELAWMTMISDPTDAVFRVPLIVPLNDRFEAELMRLLPLVSDAVEDSRAGTIRRAVPDSFQDFPCYRIEIEVPL